MMKDGYYMSGYFDIDKLGAVFANSSRHDQSMSLWKKEGDSIRLVRCWEFERFSGEKQHCRSFINLNHALDTINNMLFEYGLCFDDIQEFWGVPELQKNNYPHVEDHSSIAFHSLCHVYSALLFSTSTFKNNTILSISLGGGVDDTFENIQDNKYYNCGSLSINGKVLSIFPMSSPGLLWEAAKLSSGLREGTLMALIDATNCGINYNYNNNYMEDLNIMNLKTSKYAFDVFSKIKQEVYLLNIHEIDGYDDRFTEHENRWSLIMKIIDNLSMKMLYSQIDKIIDCNNIDTTTTVLSVSGGYALNCPSNTKLMKKYHFKSFYAPPYVSDSGQSIGIGLYEFFMNLSNINVELEDAYWGFSDNSILETISSSEFSNYIDNITTIDYQIIVNDILTYPIVWFNGNAEIGPRALGSRSILANPCNKETADILNEIKGRQWWRPVAPIILVEDVNDWFEDAYPSPFMLSVFNIKKSRRNCVPAILHINETSRIQTISRKSNTSLYDIIRQFKETTDVPMLCNTSLNDKGEPIINTIGEMLNFALRKNITVVCINGYRVQLKNHMNYPYEKPKKRFNYWNLNCIHFLRNKYNPYNLSDDELFYYSYLKLYNYSLTDNYDVKIIKKMIQLFKNKL